MSKVYKLIVETQTNEQQEILLQGTAYPVLGPGHLIH